MKKYSKKDNNNNNTAHLKNNTKKLKMHTDKNIITYNKVYHVSESFSWKSSK